MLRVLILVALVVDNLIRMVLELQHRLVQVELVTVTLVELLQLATLVLAVVVVAALVLSVVLEITQPLAVALVVLD